MEQRDASYAFGDRRRHAYSVQNNALIGAPREAPPRHRRRRRRHPPPPPPPPPPHTPTPQASPSRRGAR
jgi:hypothetical protein